MLCLPVDHIRLRLDTSGSVLEVSSSYGSHKVETCMVHLE